MIKFTLKIPIPLILLILLQYHAPITQIPHQLSLIQETIKAPVASRDLKVDLDYGKIPLYFIPNQGQADEEALFYAKASWYTLWLTKEGLVFDSMRKMAVREVSGIKFLNANKAHKVVPINETEHSVNYFIGDDESKWRTGIRTSKAVFYQELYENIDLKVYGVEKQIEYDLVVRPGGNVQNIRFDCTSTKETRIDKNGNLEVETGFGKLLYRRPAGYQVMQGKRIDVEVRFREIRDNRYGFEVKSYSKDHDLVIDPVIFMYSTYLGGVGSDGGNGIVVSSDGSAYVTGYTGSINFPGKNAYMNDPDGSLFDAFVTKLSASGSSLTYSTYLGGTGSDAGRGIAVDGDESAYVTGYTGSINFPGKNAYMNDPDGSLFDAFVTKLSASGSSLTYSTYLGGTGSDAGRGIAVDGDESAYVTGYTGSTNFPMVNAYMSDPDGSLFDAFVTKLSASGSGLVYSTYLGGTWTDEGCSIAVAFDKSVYVTGYTGSTNFPMVSAYMSDPDGSLYDAFVAKLSSSDSSPEVTIINPSDGSTVSGTVTIQASASDDYGIAKVAFYIDGDLKTTDTVSPYDYYWDTTAVNNGNHTIEVVAYDTIDQTDSDNIAVNVNNVVAWSLTISAQVGGTTDPAPGNYVYISGASVEVEAIPNSGYNFSYWSGDVPSGHENDNPLSLIMDGNKSITALFLFIPGSFDCYIFDGHDFDGNGSSDISVFRPASGTWFFYIGDSQNWGQYGDIPANGDYDGDLVTDLAVWRPMNGYWYVSGIGITHWGMIGDIPVPHDYNGGGVTDIAVWRPSNGIWYIKDVGDYQWGQEGDYPVPGDYNGDGVDEVAVWRPVEGAWYISGVGYYQWGMMGDVPVPGDYNGDGKTDLAVFRPAIGMWYIQYMGGGAAYVQWGMMGDMPVPGDYDGNGTTEVAIWRPSNGLWYIYGNGTYQWGQSGDIPLVR